MVPDFARTGLAPLPNTAERALVELSQVRQLPPPRRYCTVNREPVFVALVAHVTPNGAPDGDELIRGRTCTEPRMDCGWTAQMYG